MMVALLNLEMLIGAGCVAKVVGLRQGLGSGKLGGKKFEVIFTRKLKIGNGVVEAVRGVSERREIYEQAYGDTLFYK